DVPGGVAVVPSTEPALALGPSVLTGRPVSELAFLFGRELTQLRLTGRVLAFYPQLAEVRALVTAAIHVVVGQTGQLPPDVGQARTRARAGGRARRGPAGRRDPPRRGALGAAVRAVTDRGGRLDLLEWLRAVERAACRAGLLACGDLTIAARALSVDGHVVGGL